MTFNDVSCVFQAQENGNVCILAIKSVYTLVAMYNKVHNAHCTHTDLLAMQLQSNI